MRRFLKPADAAAHYGEMALGRIEMAQHEVEQLLASTGCSLAFEVAERLECMLKDSERYLRKYQGSAP